MSLNINRKLELKQADPFLKKFEGRYERMGSGGIKDVTLKDNIIIGLNSPNNKNKKESPINERKKNQKMYTRMMNQYNLLTNEDYKRYSLSKKNNNAKLIQDYDYKTPNNYNNYNINNNIHNFINNNNNNNLINSNYNINNSNNINMNYNFNNNYNENNTNIKDYNFSPKLSHSNSYPPYGFGSIDYNPNYNENEYNNEINYSSPSSSLLDNDRFYRPYSLKEYKNIMEKYKNDKFGGLGKNMNKEWKEREKRFNKVKQFENSIVQNFNKKMNNNYKRKESPQKIELIKLGEQIMNSKRYKAQKYGKGVMLNKVREQKKNDKLEKSKMIRMKNQEEYLNKHIFERKQREDDIVHLYDNIINEKNDNYMSKLNELKSSLI